MVTTLPLATQQDNNGLWVSLGPDHGIAMWQPESGSARGALANVRRLLPVLPLGGVLLANPASNTLLALPFHEASALDDIDLLVKANHHAGDTTDEELWFYDGETLHRVGVEHIGEEILVHPPEAMYTAMSRLYALRSMVAIEA